MLQATKGTGILYIRDEVIDRVWNTIARADDTKIRAGNAFNASEVRMCRHCAGCRAAIEFANQIGLERIENVIGRWQIMFWER